jgi:hypothetical protein
MRRQPTAKLAVAFISPIILHLNNAKNNSDKGIVKTIYIYSLVPKIENGLSSVLQLITCPTPIS